MGQQKQRGTGGLGRDAHKVSYLSEPLRRKKNSVTTGISGSALCKRQRRRGGSLGHGGLSWQTRG